MLYLAIYMPEGQPAPPRTIVNEPGLRHYVVGWGQLDDYGFAVEDRGEMVGAAWLRLLTGDNQGYGYVDDQTPELSIALQPAYRGQGLGTELLNQLLTLAQTKYPAVSLSVSPDNPAKRLYERLGFVMVGQSGDSVTMCLRWR